MAQLETLSVKLTSDTSEFSSGLDKAKESTSSFSSLASGALMGVGMAAFNMATSAASSFVGFATDGIAMASDMSETVSKVETVFGDNAGAIKQWASDAATSMGQTSSDALAAAAGFGNLFVSMGLTKDSSADMSMNLVGLATDLASFNNMSTDEALQKLKAGMLGSAEPLQSLGVNMNAAMVTAKALSMGLAGTADALTPAMLAQARYALILEQTKTAQGDFAKTSDGLANQQRIADAQWKELQTTIGTALLPVMLEITRALNDLLTSVMPPLSAFITGTLTPAMSGIAAAVGPSITATIAFFKDMYDKAGPIITSISGWVTNLGTTMKGQADGPMAYLKTWFDENMPRIQQIVNTVITALTGFWTAHGAQITKTVGDLMTWLVRIWDTSFRTILDVVTIALQLLTGDFSGAGDTLEKILSRWKEFFGDAIRAITRGIVDTFKNIDWAGLGFDIIQGIAYGISNAGSYIVSAAEQAAQSAYDAAKSYLGINSPSKLAAKGIGEPFGQGIGVGITSAMGGVAATVAASLDGLMGNASAGLLSSGNNVGGSATSANITQNFYGATDPTTVGSASISGVRAGLRAVGGR